MFFDNYEEYFHVSKSEHLLCFAKVPNALLLLQEPKFGMLMDTLKSPLTRLEDVLSKEALELFNMVG